MTDFADVQDRGDLKELWKQAFGDSEEYIDMFLDWNASLCRIAVYRAEGKIVSAAYLLPVSYIRADHTKAKAWYLYAAATLPQYRRGGFFGEVLSFIRERFLEPVFLVPAQKSLISYYERHGFWLWLEECVEKRAKNEAGQNAEACICDCTPQEYWSYREMLLKSCGSVQWSEHFIRYICHENALWSKGTQKLIVQGDRSVPVLYQIEKDTLRIKEALPKTKDTTWLYALMRETGCTKAMITWQPPVMSNRVLEGMSKKEMLNQGYFNLTMG